LVAKAVLREAGLNEVFTGGLGSYALALLVISHLQAEGMADLAMSAMLPTDHSSSSHQAGISQHLQQLAATAAAAAGSSGGSKQQQLAAAAAAGSSGGGERQQQQQQWDLGLLLQGFFLRFGALFDYQTEAVVVNQGGVLAKPMQWVKDNRYECVWLHTFTLVVAVLDSAAVARLAAYYVSRGYDAHALACFL
jgi:DNA polymerase sigma